MSLRDELHRVLTHFREHVAEQVNSGPLVAVDAHLAALEASAADAVEAVRQVLGELYGLRQAAAPVPVETPAAPAAEEAPAATATIIGEPGPELTTLPLDATVVASPDLSPAAKKSAAAAEPQAPEVA